MEQLRRRVTRHLGHRYMEDPSGRFPRSLIAVPRETITPRGVRRTFRYFPLFDTKAAIIKEGLDLRRRWGYRRIKQIDTDWQSYNDYNTVGEKIEKMSFNFDEQLEQDAMPTKYPKSAPDDIDDEDDNLD